MKRTAEYNGYSYTTDNMCDEEVTVEEAMEIHCRAENGYFDE